MSVSDVNIFGFFPLNDAAQTCNQSCERSNELHTFWEFCYFLKESVCIMIWWRQRIAVHIPTAHVI